MMGPLQGSCSCVHFFDQIGGATAFYQVNQGNLATPGQYLFATHDLVGSIVTAFGNHIRFDGIDQLQRRVFVK